MPKSTAPQQCAECKREYYHYRFEGKYCRPVCSTKAFLRKFKGPGSEKAARERMRLSKLKRMQALRSEEVKQQLLLQQQIVEEEKQRLATVEPEPPVAQKKPKRKNRKRDPNKTRKWRNAIFKRDDYTCQDCGQVGHELHAHHIKRVEYHPELCYEIDNGITLCQECHAKRHEEEGQPVIANVLRSGRKPRDTGDQLRTTSLIRNELGDWLKTAL